MYKKIKKYATENNLTVSEKNGLAYGMMNGFFIAIKQAPGTAACHTVQIWAKEGNICRQLLTTVPKSPLIFRA